MSNERVEAEFTVPASTQVSVTTVAHSATSVTAPSGSVFMTDFLAGFQTALNNASQGYPTLVAAANSAIGGTWTTGQAWLCNESSGNLAPAFGATTLTATSLTYGTAGPRAGIDKAIGFDAATDNADGGNIFDVGAADDLIVAWVGFLSAVPGGSVGLITKFSSTGWYIQFDAGGNLNFGAFRAGPTSDFNCSLTAAIGSWYVGIATIDRGTGKGRVGIRTLAGATTLSAEQTATAASYTTAGAFRLGQRSDGGASASTGSLVAAAYAVSGVGAASGLSAGLSAALATFANAVNAAWAVSMSASTGLVSIGWTGYTTPTWSLSWNSTELRDLLGFTANITSVTTTQTGTQMPSGVWFPGRPINLDSDPLQAPTGDDKTSSISPTGRVYSLASSTYFRHRNVRFPMVAQNLVWANSATTVGADWETFYLETQVGQHDWFEVGSRVVVFWDNAGVLTELGNGDVEAWRMPQCEKLDDLRLSTGTWTGLVDVELGDLYADQ